MKEKNERGKKEGFLTQNRHPNGGEQKDTAEWLMSVTRIWEQKKEKN